MRPAGGGPARSEPATPATLLEAAPGADIVEIPARSVVTIDAGGPDLQPSLGVLREVMRRLRRARRQRGAAKIPSAPLERRCWFEAAAGSLTGPGRARWSLRLGVPADLTEQELAEALLPQWAGGHQRPLSPAGVRLEHLAPAVMGRVLHLGPMVEVAVAASLARVRRALESARMEPTGAHLEVYLQDAQRTAAPGLRTALLMETGGQRRPPHPLPTH